MKEILKSLQDMEIDKNGHGVSVDFIKSEIERTVENLGDNVGKFARIIKQHPIDYLISKVNVHNCQNCGMFLQLIREDNKLKVVNREDHSHCNATDLNKVEVLLNFSSGLINFRNFIQGMATDCPKEDEWSPEYSLNSTVGILNRVKHNATFNVGYAQTTNTVVYFYMNKEETEIYVYDYSAVHSECDGCDKEDGSNLDYCKNECGYIDHYKADISELTYIGKISCEVWRWMCYDSTDHETLKAYTIEATKDENKYHKIDADKFDKIPYDIGFTHQIKKGTWKLTNYLGWWKDGSLISKLEFIV